MMRQYQQGIATLLITSILLSVALVITLGSYKTLFYQIKRAQNEVKSRQDHWLAEGGLECIYTKSVQDGVVPNASSIPECNTASHTITFTYESLPAKDPTTKINSKIGYTHLSKNIVIPSSGGGVGAIRSSSNLIANASVTISPEPGEIKTDGNQEYYECVSMVVRDKAYFGAGFINSDLNYSAGVNPGASYKNGVKCGSGFTTSSGSSVGYYLGKDGLVTNNGLELDAKRNPDLSPFKDFFGKKVSDWKSVRDDPKNNFKKISTTKGSDCFTKIKDAELKTDGNNAIWIDGPCEFDSNLANLLSKANHPKMKVLLVVHNGIVGGRSAVNVNGVFVHVNSTYTPTKEQWSNAEFDPLLIASLKHNPNDFKAGIEAINGKYSDGDATLATMYMEGSFNFTGGMILDAKNQTALFKNSVNIKFNLDLLKELVNSSLPPRWQEGSWNAQ
ncbi:hypothetical protein [Vibrio navarrensis]|uniref:hypothetical protein n=1 Tax=Vibrio navarrensis TaxID=29495 RepID=UPI00051DF5AF|nr:hypothetical protein [Vibrio navarrensis]KGK17055.1 hypothetical protein EA24_10480 [Vibrio navarrensis]KGK21314.1 hypothetical protein DC58_17260 [Vibrio navarrensis]